MFHRKWFNSDHSKKISVKCPEHNFSFGSLSKPKFYMLFFSFHCIMKKYAKQKIIDK